MRSSLASLIVAVFKGNSVEYTSRIFSLSATQFTVKKCDFPNSSDSQGLIEIVYVRQLQTLHEFLHRKNNFGTVSENLTGELDATIIK